MGTRFGLFAAIIVGLFTGCTRPVDVDKERAALLAVDSEWMRSANDPAKFASFYDSTASFYAPGMPVVKGQESIREVYKQVASAPGFSLAWTVANSQIGASGDVAYLTGTYELKQDGGGEKGKYITVWKKQADGGWKVVEDIFNPNESPPPPAPPAPVPGHHTHVAPPQLTWGDAPPALPAGAKFAVVSGDPGKPEPFVVRLQLPSGYTVAPHWHPTDEHVTVLTGTLSLGMGETFDKAALQDLPVGGYALLPAEMRHYAVAKTAATIQVHGTGPFVINYVNPADDPSKKN
jgi:ketosteroid isomerase-like protein